MAVRFDRVLMLRIIGNFVIPFVVSNRGALAPGRRPSGLTHQGADNDLDQR